MPRAELRESIAIVQQALDGMPEGPIKADAPKVVLPDREKMKTQMEALIYHFKIITEGFAVPEGEVYQAVESPRGEMGYYIVSDGTAKPYRVHMRSACLANMQTAAEDVRRQIAGGCGGGDRQHRYRVGRNRSIGKHEPRSARRFTKKSFDVAFTSQILRVLGG